MTLDIPYIPPLYEGVHKPGVLKVNSSWAYVPPVRPNFRLNLDREETTSDTGVSLEKADAWRRERFPIQRTNRFPSKLIEKALGEAIAARTDLSPGNIVVGNGIMSLLTYVYDIYLAPGTNVVVPTPGFWPAYTYALQRARGILMPLYEGKRSAHVASFSFPLAATREALGRSAALCYISNPNNPTGTLIAQEIITDLVASYPDVLFVIDEAYGPFACSQLGRTDFELSETSALIREGFPNLVVARTFSKVYAMANYRVGYLLSHTSNIETIRAHMGPYDMCELSLALALYNFCNDSYAREIVLDVAKNKAAYEQLLESFGVTHYAGYRNSILVDGLELAEEYERHQIAVRSMVYQDLIPNPVATTFRIAIPSDSENFRFLTEVTTAILSSAKQHRGGHK